MSSFNRLLPLVLLTVFSAPLQAAPAGKAAALIEQLHMEKIPDEGAWFAATYRSTDVLGTSAVPARYKGVPHSAGSAIYALVTREDFSAMHRLGTDETWHYYGGDPLELLVLHPDGRGETILLGGDVFAGQQPQFTVPHGAWMGAKPAGKGSDSYTFFGNTLAPGFEYQDFISGYRDELQQQYPAFAGKIAGLTRPAFATKPANAKSAVAPTALESAGRSLVLVPADVAKIDAAAGIALRELVGREAKAKTSDYSVALFTLDAGRGMPVSYNKVAKEVFLVSSGSGEVTLGNDIHPVGPGSTVVIDRQVRHSIRATNDSALSFYAISVPAFEPADYVVEK
jgi:predicted cupin superfamily sugar epimerase/mannose-6-phosphate isomerase-like protein (cupin superfamily)